MAITSTQSEHQVRNLTIGRYITSSTAAAFDLTTGFKPRYVRVVNVTSRDMLEWFEGMDDASAIKSVAAGTRTLITTLGITPLDDGFTVGLDADVNVINEQLSWIAQG